MKNKASKCSGVYSGAISQIREHLTVAQVFEFIAGREASGYGLISSTRNFDGSVTIVMRSP